MAKSPQWKVYDSDGVYQGAVKEPVAAAALVSLYGDGAEVRDGHSKSRVVWTEGWEDIPAGESYDRVSWIMCLRAGNPSLMGKSVTAIEQEVL